MDPFGPPGLALPVSNGDDVQPPIVQQERPKSAKPPERAPSPKRLTPSAQS